MRDTHDRFALAVDYGERRIGIAYANTVSGNAQALTTLQAKAGTPDWSEFDTLVGDWQPNVFVVGIPSDPAAGSGDESPMIQRITMFAATLKARYGLPVVTVDESLTSVEAESELREQRRSGIRTRRLNKGDIDSTAARLIAESWLRNVACGQPE